MRYRTLAVICSLLFATLACGLPGPALAPTALALPPTPDFQPQPLPVATSGSEGGAFAGTWSGPDPDDGSIMTMTLTQLHSGSTLGGTYSDTYSGSITPPGYQGTVTGSVITPTTGQATLTLTRHDGVSLVVQVDLTLTGPDKMTAQVTSQSPVGLWVLERQ